VTPSLWYLLSLRFVYLFQLVAPKHVKSIKFTVFWDVIVSDVSQVSAYLIFSVDDLLVVTACFPEKSVPCVISYHIASHRPNVK